MKRIFHSLYRSVRTTPFLGRTIVVLSFFCLLLKQAFLFRTYGELFLEATSVATLVHYIGYFVSDYLVCMVILGLVAINSLMKKTLIKLINNIIIITIFLLFVLDIFTMYFFQSRISVFDMNQFINPSLGDFSSMVINILIVVCILGIITFFIVQSPSFKKNKKILLALYFLLFSIGCVGVGMYAPGGFNSIPDNVLSINFQALQHNIGGLSDMYAPKIYQKFFAKKFGLQQQTNIIVLFAESLSPIDSLRVGGVHNNLPYFDLIQKQGITFTNFIANGCTSDTAHVGLLLGVEPFSIPGAQIGAYSGYKTYTDSLPTFFHQQGYTTTFISSVDLDFLNQRTFLSGAGFDHIIGEERFADKKKYVFNAAPDHSLYSTTLDTIKKQKSPYFLVLQNISFHKPYNTPYGTTQKDAIRYTDKSLYYFYLQLKKAGFFNNGVLVIVSDHRKMEPLETKEKEALGEFWYTKGLATIVGTGITPGIINRNIIQHTDIFYSLKQFAGKGIITLSKLFNDIFSSNKKRNRGIVYCRYFNNSNKYTVVGANSTGKVFNELAAIRPVYPFIYQYLSSYIAFEQGSGALLSGKNAMVLIAHQGSPLQEPENSLSGFLLAHQHGANGIEFDVSQTKDKQNIVAHGERLRGTVCGNDYIVYNHTLEKLKRECPMKNGQKIMTLEEMLKAVDGLFEYYFVEIKVYNSKDAEAQTTAAIQTVQKLGMQDRVIFTSYDKTATYVLGSYTNITAGWDTYNITELTTLPNMNHQYYLMPQTLIKSTTPQEVADIGKKLVVYTVNTTGDLEKLYRQGVRMVMTDNVPLLKARADDFLSQ